MEVGIVVAILVVALGGSAMVAYAPWWWMFGGGLVMVAIGMAVGVPAGFLYHVHLHRTLAPRGLLPRRWWLHPVRYHALIDDQAARKRMMFWFALGAIGWVIAVAGCLFVGIGTFRS